MDCVNCKFCGDTCIFEEEEACYGDLLDENENLKAKVTALNGEIEQAQENVRILSASLVSAEHELAENK